MKKIGIFYGSSTGYTADAATKIASALGVQLADVHDVANASPSMLGEYDVLVLGTSTHGNGELQDDWYDLIDGIEALDLSDKTIALFGCGDESMSDTFCSALVILYERLKGTGAKFVGSYNADGFKFDHSRALIDGKMIGLVLDDINHPDLTDKRVEEWAEQLKKEIG